MTASDKLKQRILYDATGVRHETPDAVRAAWKARYDNQHFEDAINDAMSELRSGEEETGLPCPSSRHYESKSIAARMMDGSWVGWTYWYGGGKHGEPYSIPWVEDAYDLEMVEVQRVVREFRRACGSGTESS
jgi:hypothetical protein